jgi:hypothetical protein
MSTATRGSETLSDRFDLEEQFLAKPDSAALTSALIRAHDRRQDEPVILKYWNKTGTPIDADLREMWRHEMRQVERVRAYPGAAEVIVDFEQGETADAFFFAMPGDLGTLDHIRRHAVSSHWLRNLGGVRHRALLWRNIRRLAQALGAVHGQGMVHGHLSEATIFAASSADADFRLGGFEWCVRIAEIEKAPVARIARDRDTPIILSFVDDWRALGLLTADILGLDARSLDTQYPVFQAGRPTFDLHPSEVDFLRRLLKPERHRGLEARAVTGEIDAMLAELGIDALDDTGIYVLALRLGERRPLTHTLREISDDAFDASDIDAQLDFVRADLATGAALVPLPNGEFKLLTQLLAYRLRPLSRAGADATWRVANCDQARPRDEFFLGRRPSTVLPAHRIELIRYGAAERRLKELRDQAIDWAKFFGKSDEDDPSTAIRRGLLLAQVAEALFQVAAILPVQIIGKPRKTQDGRTVVRLAPRDDEDRADLVKALRVKGPVQLMARLFKEEEADLDATWELSESGGLGRPGRNSPKAEFVRVVASDRQRVYEFSLDGPVPPTAELYLRQRDEGRTEGAIRRRLQMLATLVTQQELSRMLASPRDRLVRHSDPLEEDEAFATLDKSKKDALRAIWSTGPAEFVVGPPGVGKTRLVTEVVRRVVSRDPAARLLLSAQAHQALDHLASAVQAALGEAGIGEDVILVRSKANAGAALDGVQPQDRAAAYLRAIGKSSLGLSAPVTLRQALDAMESAAASKGRRGDTEVTRQRHSFEALVLRCANVLFSTVNSADLAQLVEDKAQFDWVMIEEAAKATGPELLAPLLLSMRRLLIGDHNQLPPFDTDRIARFLADRTAVRTALAKCDRLIGPVFRDFGLDELKEAIADEAAIVRTCEAASRMLLLFESLVRQQLEWQGNHPERLSIATELREQHRMHPVIATIVAECFYPAPGQLITAKESLEAFADGVEPFFFEGGAFPASPVVIVDMPYVQSAPGARERLPVYHNPAEREAIMAVLASLRPRGAASKPPTLAVLSPYRQQVKRLEHAIVDGLGGKLSALAGFRSPVKSGELAGTVDSFQGSEADIVLISLVRNNDHTGKRALGFLSDRRRMNVLLSRAKWKLVIVTSLQFLRVQSRRYSGRRADGESFLATLLTTLNRLGAETLPNGVPKLAVLPGAALTKGRR